MGFEHRHQGGVSAREELVEALARIHRLELARARELLLRAEQAAAEDPQARSVRQWFALLLEEDARAAGGWRTAQAASSAAPTRVPGRGLGRTSSPRGTAAYVPGRETLVMREAERASQEAQEKVTRERRLPAPTLPVATPAGASQPGAAPQHEPGRLDVALQWRMSEAFGFDFSGVSIRRDSPLATGGTRALVKDGEVHFREGEYRPGTRAGDWLIAHELAHIVQQQAGRGDRPAPRRAIEREADRAATLAILGHAAPIALRAQPAVAYAYSDGEEHEPDTSDAGADDGHTAAGHAAAGAAAAPAAPAEALQLAREGTRTVLPYRAILEQRYRTTLQNLEVYTGNQAAQACAMVHAQAFTVGNIIVLASDTPPLEVVAHEVAHALQQGGDKQPLGAPPSNLGMSRESDSAEHEAHQQGQAAAADMTPAGSSKPEQPGKDAAAGQSAFQEGNRTGTPVLSRFPSPPDCHTFRPGLSFISPIIKAGYDGNTYTAIKTGWESKSWERRWQIYDAEDNLLYESYYTWPSPTLKIPKDVVARGKAGGKDRPWSVWIKVTKTLVPFGGSDANFPHAYMKFNVYDTWNDYLADPDAKPGAVKPPSGPNDKAPSGSVVASPGAKAAGSVVDYGSVVAMNEAYLREIYDASAKQLSELAQDLVKQGVPQKDVAEWANQARNNLKAKIRSQGNPILQRVFEQRNLAKYGDKLGPSYEQLYAKYAKSGLTPDEINAKIIQGAGKANAGFNRWAGRLKFAGRLALALDICLAAVRVYMAPEGEKVKTALREVARIGGALALGAAGAEAGAALGAAVGAAFAGVGAVPGAVIGGIVFGIGGAILGGYLAEQLVAKLYEMFPPDDCKFEGDFTEGVKAQ